MRNFLKKIFDYSGIFFVNRKQGERNLQIFGGNCSVHRLVVRISLRIFGGGGISQAGRRKKGSRAGKKGGPTRRKSGAQGRYGT